MVASFIPVRGTGPQKPCAAADNERGGQTWVVGRAAECSGLENRITVTVTGVQIPHHPLLRTTTSDHNLDNSKARGTRAGRPSVTSQPCTALAFLVRIQVELSSFPCPCSSEAEQPTFNRWVEMSEFSGGTVM